MEVALWPCYIAYPASMSFGLTRNVDGSSSGSEALRKVWLDKHVFNGTLGSARSPQGHRVFLMQEPSSEAWATTGLA